MNSMLRFLSVALLLSVPWSAASAADNTQFDLLKDMSVADYRATGLDKLSDAQVKALSVWFANYESQQSKDCTKSATMVSATAPAAAASKPAVTTSKHHKLDGSVVTTSRINGTFSGWYGGTVFKLENGETWEQTDDSLVPFAAVSHPVITISKGTSDTYYLEVKGMTDSVPVRKVEPDDSN